jgi:hypothetical protein
MRTSLIQLAGPGGVAVQVFATFAAHGAPPASPDRLEIAGGDPQGPQQHAQRVKVMDEDLGDEHPRLVAHERLDREAAAWMRAGVIGRPFAARLDLVTSGTLPDGAGRYPGPDRSGWSRRR